MALTLKDALKHASEDPKFLSELANNPENIKKKFNLSEEQVTKLKGIGGVINPGRGVQAYYWD